MSDPHSLCPLSAFLLWPHHLASFPFHFFSNPCVCAHVCVHACVWGCKCVQRCVCQCGLKVLPVGLLSPLKHFSASVHKDQTGAAVSGRICEDFALKTSASTACVLAQRPCTSQLPLLVLYAQVLLEVNVHFGLWGHFLLTLTCRDTERERKRRGRSPGSLPTQSLVSSGQHF